MAFRRLPEITAATRGFSNRGATVETNSKSASRRVERSTRDAAGTRPSRAGHRAQHPARSARARTRNQRALIAPLGGARLPRRARRRARPPASAAVPRLGIDGRSPPRRAADGEATAGCSKCRYAARGCGRCEGFVPAEARAPAGEATGARRRAARAARRERARGGVRADAPGAAEETTSTWTGREDARTPATKPGAARVSASSAKKAPPRELATRRIPGPVPRVRDRRPRLRRRERRPAAPPRPRGASHHRPHGDDVTAAPRRRRPRRLETLTTPGRAPLGFRSPRRTSRVPPARRDPASLVPGRLRPNDTAVRRERTTQLCGAASRGGGWRRESPSAARGVGRYLTPRRPRPPRRPVPAGPARRPPRRPREGASPSGDFGAPSHARGGGRREYHRPGFVAAPPPAASASPFVKHANGSGRTLKAACELGVPRRLPRGRRRARGSRRSDHQGRPARESTTQLFVGSVGRGRGSARGAAALAGGRRGRSGGREAGRRRSEGTRAVVRERHGVGSYDREATNESGRVLLRASNPKA